MYVPPPGVKVRRRFSTRYMIGCALAQASLVVLPIKHRIHALRNQLIPQSVLQDEGGIDYHYSH